MQYYGAFYRSALYPLLQRINAMMESFWGTMQLELLDSKPWETREELANAMFAWIECWYNSRRRHSGIGMHSPVTFEALHTRSDQDHPGPRQGRPSRRVGAVTRR